MKRNKIKQIFAWCVGIIFAIVIILPCLLYIPIVQDGVKNLATYYVNNNTALKMELGRISLKFPLNLNVKNALILDENQDTMVYVGNALLDVNLKSIMKQKVKIPMIEAKNVVYNMLGDTAMILKARIKDFSLSQSDIFLKTCEVNLGNAKLDGGSVTMILNSTQDSVPVDTASTELAWKVNLGSIQVQNVAYNMQMLPLIENLDAKIGKAVLREAMVDLGKLDVKLKYLGVGDADVKYIYPSTEWLAEHHIVEDTLDIAESADTASWTVNVEAVRLSDSHAIYAMSGAEPIQGLDMNFLELSDVNIGIDSLYNKGVDIKLSLTQLSARERCGIFVTSGSGVVSMSEDEISAQNFRVETMQSKLIVDAIAGMDFAPEAETPISLKVQSAIGLGEIGRAYPDLVPILKNIPQYNPLQLELAMQGNTKKLDLRTAILELPQYLKMELAGNATNVMDMDKLAANIDFSGDFKNLNFVKPIMLSDTTMHNQIDFPIMILSGYAKYAPNKADIAMNLDVDSGRFDMRGKWDGLKEIYHADVELDSFPMQAILPTLNLEDISMKMHAEGKGYDIYNLDTKIDARLMIEELVYENKRYSKLGFDAQLENSYLSLDVDSKNKDCVMDMSLSCMLNPDYYEFGVDGEIKNLDLKAMRISDEKSRGKGKIAAYGTIDFERGAYNADVNLKDFEWNMTDATYSTPEVVVSLLSSKDSLAVYAYEEDMFINFNTPTGLDSLMVCMDKCQAILEYEINNKYLDVDTLQEALPPMVCELRIGKKNLVQQALRSYDMKMKNLSLDLVNDSTIFMKGRMQGLEAFAMKIDTIDIDVSQRNKYLSYKLHAGSRPGTNDEFAQVTLSGGVRGNKLGVFLNQKNIRGEHGFRVGLNALLGDTAINVNLFPKEPIIGYRKWTVNEENLVEYNYTNNNFNADLSLRSDSSFVSLKAQHKELETRASQDVLFSIGGVQISEWLRVSPFIPPMSGVLNADMKMKYNGKHVWGGGTTRIHDFKYNRKPVGDFDLKVMLALDPEINSVRLRSSFDVDGKQTITLQGVLNDTTSQNPFKLKLKVDSFPLRVVDPFIPGNMAKMAGTLNGDMNVLGSMSEPILNGYIQCDDAGINMPLFGSKLTLSDNKVPIDSSIVQFDGLKIVGSNKKSIDLNGYVDMRSIDNPKMDLSLKGRNVEFVNSKQQRKMEVFGKGYANVDVAVKGSMNDMNVDAALTILPTTNLTYVMQTDVASIATQTDENLVQFVTFADTAEMEADTINIVQATTSNFMLNAKLNIQQGAKFNVYLSESGNDRCEIEGSGVLNYSQSSLGDERLVGQFTLNNGYVKYTPPLLSEKRFDLTPGSYVSWTGDMFNPVLNIKAVDTMKASVSQEGQDSRMINFDVSLDITNTLSNMDLAFDLSTSDDMTVQNELLSMSPSQRSSQAINLLLYGTYTGMGTTANTSGNPLYSFLNSQINRWAANTIKGVDLTLGVNQYGSGNGDDVAKSTSYSYKISKSLFNDRFKIVVGGSFDPTGDNTNDNLANSLLNDISFVYMLNQSGTMQIKLFRHTGYESILEGEVTETGGAFVVKRKATSMKELFRFGRRKFKKGQPGMNSKDSTMSLKGNNVEHKPKEN